METIRNLLDTISAQILGWCLYLFSLIDVTIVDFEGVKAFVTWGLGIGFAITRLWNEYNNSKIKKLERKIKEKEYQDSLKNKHDAGQSNH